MRLGIIGATGWLGSALTRALIKGGLVPASGLVLLNRSGSRPSDLAGPGVAWAASPADLVAQSEAVVVSVRPEDFLGLRLRASGRLVISFMAGVPLAVLERDTGGRIVRAMPNASAERRASYTPWLAGAGVSEADRAFVRRLLARIGREDEVASEVQLDILTGLSGSGAAYPALMAEAMLMQARALGLPEQVAIRAVEAAVCNGAEMLRGRVETAGTLLAAYRDYRGTTAAGLETAEAMGFSAAIAAALRAAAGKAARMWPPTASPTPGGSDPAVPSNPSPPAG